MKNIFSDLSSDKTYDLKGSTHSRTSRRGGQDISSVLKDLDWLQDQRKLKLEKGLQSYISQVIEADVGFLQSINVMDYSLLLGIHNVKGDPGNYMNSLMRDIDRTNKYPNGAKKPIHNDFRGGVVASDKSCVYMLGIIDIFTFYSGKKKAENFFKTVVSGKGISCVPPDVYGQRFKNFIFKQFA